MIMTIDLSFYHTSEKDDDDEKDTHTHQSESLIVILIIAQGILKKKLSSLLFLLF